jgi:hypothetical protein
MNLSNFNYNTSSGFVYFSSLITKALYDVSKNLGYQFNPVNYRRYSYWQPNEDMIEWDPCPNEIGIGRYLEKIAAVSIPKKPPNINFWIGLDVGKSATSFTIWLDKATVDTTAGYLLYLQGSGFTYIDKVIPAPTKPNNKYYIVYMKNDKFKGFCDATSGNSKNLKDKDNIMEFIAEVL